MFGLCSPGKRTVIGLAKEEATCSQQTKIVRWLNSAPTFGYVSAEAKHTLNLVTEPECGHLCVGSWRGYAFRVLSHEICVGGWWLRWVEKTRIRSQDI